VNCTNLRPLIFCKISHKPSIGTFKILLHLPQWLRRSSTNKPSTQKSAIRMSRNLISSMLHSITVAFSPQVTASNTLNPIHLAIATRGYWIQSRIFYIPDRYGFFSPGPPRLQVYQGFLFIALFIMVICSIFCGASSVLLASLTPDHKPIWKAVVFMVILVGGTVAMIWVTECFSKRRARDYDWGDWKQRKD
jgi:hypothetical protein